MGLEERLEALQQRMAERREAERPYAVPGLDVPWWKEEPPIRVWTHEDILCAIGPGYMGLNGYVLLPQGHPWQTRDLQTDDYELVSVHGGITFGPHCTGWIGFDTAHAGDWWSDEEIAAVPGTEEIQAARSRLRGQIGSDVLGLGPSRSGFDRQWTLNILLAEVEDLARQVKEAMPDD